MRILNLQVSKKHGIRIVENKDGGIDVVRFEIDGHYVTHKPGIPEELIATIPINRRQIVAEFINIQAMVQDEPTPPITRG